MQLNGDIYCDIFRSHIIVNIDVITISDSTLTFKLVKRSMCHPHSLYFRYIWNILHVLRFPLHFGVALVYFRLIDAYRKLSVTQNLLPEEQFCVSCLGQIRWRIIAYFTLSPYIHTKKTLFPGTLLTSQITFEIVIFQAWKMKMPSASGCVVENVFLGFPLVDKLILVLCLKRIETVLLFLPFFYPIS